MRKATGKEEDVSKKTYKAWIRRLHYRDSGYYSFKTFKVYWAYIALDSESVRKNPKPLHFEQFLIDNGFHLSAGRLGDFSTYTNISRVWEDSQGNWCTIGVTGSPAKIGLIYPILPWQDSFMPTPEMYPEVLDLIKQ